MQDMDSSSKLFSDSGQKGYESSRTDSGFLSGANLLSEENLSVNDLGLEATSFDVDCDKNTQLDSGVDVGLNEQFTKLTLTQKNCGDSSSSKSRHSNVDCSKSKENKCDVGVCQPWELYFQQDEEGDTQLHIAIIQGFIEVVYSLIRLVPHPCFLDLLNNAVQSPLHLGVITRQPRIVRRLVVAGANVETQDGQGNTPLHLACQMGDIETVKSLTQPVSLSEVNSAGLLYSDNHARQVPQNLEERNYEGETCLHLAAYGGHTDVLRHLIWFGANVNAKEHKSGQTVLHHAVETSNQKLFRFLLEEGSSGPSTGLVIDTPNYAGHTAYQIARILNRKMAEDLEKRGARVDVEDIAEDEDEHPDHNLYDVFEEGSELDNQCTIKALRV